MIINLEEYKEEPMSRDPIPAAVAAAHKKGKEEKEISNIPSFLAYYSS